MNDVYELLKELKSRGARIYAVDDKIKLDIRKEELTKEISEKIRHFRNDILAIIGETAKSAEFIQIEKVEPQKSYPISDAQRRLWIFSQFEDSSVAYHIPGNTYLNANIEIESFKKAIESVVDRHEILRTVFKADGSGEIKQWILSREELGFKINYVDYRNEPDKHELIRAILSEDATKRFDMETGPLFRAGLIQVEDEDYVYYYNMHHIISDGWSMSVLFRDIQLYYEAYSRNKLPELKELRIQYKDYSAWQLSQFGSETFKAHRAYWLDSLKGELPVLNLPSRKPRPRIKTYNGQFLNTQYIGAKTTTKLKKYTEENGGGIFMGLFAAWNVLVYRYTSQTDIITGTPTAGRDHVDLKEQIGFYVNTLAIRNKVEPDESFNALFSRVRQNMINAYSHQAYPFNRLVDELDLRVNTSRSVVFDSLLVFHSNNGAERQERVELKQDSSTKLVELNSTSTFDIELIFNVVGDYLSLVVVFNPDVYEKEMIERLVTHYKQLLNALLENPEEKISQVDYLSEKEKKELLITFNATQLPVPAGKTVVKLFEEQALRTPENIALVFNEDKLTYRELDERSGRLAGYLVENYEIRPGDMVGVQLHRSTWLIVSMLAILKSGAAYVPIDPEYPSSRKEHIIKDTAIKLLITEAGFIHDTDYYEGSVFAIDVELDTLPTRQRFLESVANPEDLAYIIYTSGSTGQPKGVMVEHASLVNLCTWHITRFSVTEKDRASMYAGLAFDASIWEIFPYIISGACLYIIPQTLRLDSAKLNTFFETNGITLGFLPTPVAEQFLEFENNSLRYLLTGGEKLNQFKKRSYQLVNNYGPTESTVVATSYVVNEPVLNIPIGKPIANTRIYILSETLRLEPVGIVGEIYIGGAGVARGYLNQEELSAGRFIESPFHKNERLYKTGDLGRWLPDGNIEFLGRKDEQVKLRGYRIELGEIEHTLLKKEDVKEAVVLVRENRQGEKELAAYFTGKAALSPADLRAYLKELLPEYMLPAYFVQMEEMPLTANGKTDKRSLPDPEGMGLTDVANYVPPRDEVEEKLVKIWEEVLKRENIGIKDDFFALGGHSLKLIKMINQINKHFGLKYDLRGAYTESTIESLAALIHNSKRSAFRGIEKAALQESYPVSDAQRRLWVLSQFEGGSVAYNVPASTYLAEEIDIDNFEKAVQAVIGRHEILRTVFREDSSGAVRQWIRDERELNFNIRHVDFSEEEDSSARVQAYMHEDAYQPFDLENGPLLRAALLKLSGGGHMFYYNMHHIVSDGWSMEVLAKDVFACYNAYRNNKQPDLPALKIQYKDYSVWQLAQLEEEAFKAHRAYWLDSLKGELPLLDLPGAKPRPAIRTHNGQVLGAFINASLTDRLKHYTREHGGSSFMVLLAAWNILMYRYTSQKDLIIGTPIAGRGHSDLEEQIGFYTNTLALRTEIQAGESFNQLFSRTRENTLRAYAHQMYPFDRLVDELALRRDTSRNALFDIVITLQNNGEVLQDFKLAEEELERVTDLGYRASKFDIDLSFKEIGDYLSLQLVYNPDIYDQEMMEDMIRHYRQLLYAVLQYPDEKIAQVDFLSEAEKKTLLSEFNTMPVSYLAGKTIVDLFSEQVTKAPDHTAVIFENRKLTYRELDEQATRFARYLQKKYSIAVEDKVAIRLERSEWMIISLLGILKTGAAYVPVDPNYPADRMEYIRKDTQYKVCVDKAELERFLNERNDYSGTGLTCAATGNNLAYVIYTSGSTGQPKGVMIEHVNLVALVAGFTLEKSRQIAGTTQLTFDIAGLEIWGALCQGKSLVLFSAKELSDPSSFLQQIRDSGVDTIQLTPSRLSQVYSVTPRFPECVSVLLVGGEMLNGSLYRTLREERFESFNVYGPTETTVWSTRSEIKESSSLNIGGPLPGEQVYILSEEGALQPVGVKGEICIGGSGVGRGYLNQEALSREKFITNPFIPGDRLYKTGDIGRWRKDGSIEITGRNDDQVKIRGYRIELGEIEHALLGHKDIKEAVVLARTNQAQEKELVAYITSGTDLNTTSLREHLRKSLPEYMLPAHYVELPELPLNTNGKIDRRLLPDPLGLQLESGAIYQAPTNETEEKLVKIWEGLLQRKPIGVNDDFFVLGGHSIKVIQANREYRRTLDKQLPLGFFISNPTIAGHAAYLASAQEENNDLLVRLNTFSGSKRTMIMVPPVQGEALYFMNFAGFMENEFNCYGINYSQEPGFSSFAGMGTYYAESIAKQLDDRREKIIVLGFSMGASIAFEIVKVLEAQAFNCELLLIDHMSDSHSFMNHMEASRVNYKEIWLSNQVSDALKVFPGSDLAQLWKKMSRNYAMLSGYKAEGKINAGISCLEGIRDDHPFDMTSWKEHTAGRFSKRKINALHHGIFTQENYRQLAEWIRKETAGDHLAEHGSYIQ